MKESNYWEQFCRTGKIEDYLHYRVWGKETEQTGGSAVDTDGASFTASYREPAGNERQDGASDAGPYTGFGDRFESGTHRGI